MAINSYPCRIKGLNKGYNHAKSPSGNRNQPINKEGTFIAYFQLMILHIHDSCAKKDT